MAELRTFHPFSPPLQVDDEVAAIFRQAFRALDQADCPYVVGGGLATYMYTGILRDVHDLDLQLQPDDVERAMQALQRSDFEVVLKHGPWLAQACQDQVQVDLIYGLGTWHISTQPNWIERGQVVEMLGQTVRLAPPEELLWSKAFRCSRYGYDGNDIIHLLEAVGDKLDWSHLYTLFGEDWEVLLSHLLMFRYAFPSRADVIPHEVLDMLIARLAQTQGRRAEMPICRGAMLDSNGTYDQYFEARGYLDDRQLRWAERMADEQQQLPTESNAQVGQKHEDG